MYQTSNQLTRKIFLTLMLYWKWGNLEIYLGKKAITKSILYLPILIILTIVQGKLHLLFWKCQYRNTFVFLVWIRTVYYSIKTSVHKWSFVFIFTNICNKIFCLDPCIASKTIKFSGAINQRTKMSTKLIFLCSAKLREDKYFREWIKTWYLKEGTAALV